MMLYTLVPMEQIMEQQQQPASLVELEYQGVLMQVEQISLQEARIVRLLSPDPNVYLNPQLTPGNRIRMQGMI
ncbi:YlzJ-like family protein [Paenibacillus sp. y28]|uniref:YlzJ-like family protein n=1 Tax=Paenibacillus sp. y28 TaxID=3129110 RepID=UPI003016C5E4